LQQQSKKHSISSPGGRADKKHKPADEPHSNPEAAAKISAALSDSTPCEKQWPIEKYAAFAVHDEWKDMLKAEVELMHQRERVARMRRNLTSFKVNNDYTFTTGPADLSVNDPSTFRTVRFADLFGGKKYLIVDHLMFKPGDNAPCFMCAFWADGYSHMAPFVNAKEDASFVLVAKAPLADLRTYARRRGWTTIPLYSCAGTTFNLDFHVENEKQDQKPAVSVFSNEKDGIYHRYISQMSMADFEHRGIDIYNPVWHLLDLLPSGRGQYYPPAHGLSELLVTSNGSA